MAIAWINQWIWDPIFTQSQHKWFRPYPGPNAYLSTATCPGRPNPRHGRCRRSQCPQRARCGWIRNVCSPTPCRPAQGTFGLVTFGWCGWWGCKKIMNNYNKKKATKILNRNRGFEGQMLPKVHWLKTFANGYRISVCHPLRHELSPALGSSTLAILKPLCQQPILAFKRLAISLAWWPL